MEVGMHEDKACIDKHAHGHVSRHVHGMKGTAADRRRGQRGLDEGGGAD